MLLENENKNLKKDLKHYKQAAEYVIFSMTFFSVYFGLIKNRELDKANIWIMVNVPELNSGELNYI